ncbi:T-complex protein 1 subunit beta, partial [Ceratobasidium sp. UAMH 11750]
INIFVNRQLIYNYSEALLTEAGIMVTGHVAFDGVGRLSLVTDEEIASTFDRPELVKRRKCDVIEEITIQERASRSSICLGSPLVKLAQSSSTALLPGWLTRRSDLYTML